MMSPFPLQQDTAINKPTHLIAVDAGGTKTVAIAQEFCSQKNWRILIGPASLTNDLESACQSIKQVIEQLVTQSECDVSRCIVVCGIAGAGNNERANKLREVIGNEYFDVQVTTDARTSLFGASKGKPMIVAAIGTGTVVMKLDAEGCEKQFGGWGFPVGDLGGGAYIGKKIVSHALTEFDSENKISPLSEELLDKIGNDRQTILSWLVNAKPADFAQFSPLVFEFSRSDKTARNIIIQAGKEVSELILSAQENSSLPVAIIGGLAELIFPFLDDRVKQHFISTKGNALDGALYLANEMNQVFCNKIHDLKVKKNKSIEKMK